MLKELLSVLKGEHPLQQVSVDFNRMLRVAQQMLHEASEVYWGRHQTPEQRTGLYALDIEVNKLERAIRKRIAAHLSGRAQQDVPYGLLMMSLVKDVERLGDYAKNLSEVAVFCATRPKDDELTGELQEIASSTQALAQECVEVFEASDRERAQVLTVEGRSVAKRCDELVLQVATSQYAASEAVYVTLGARFYKRIEGHLLNVLSSVIMPLHKLDYYDEDVLDRQQPQANPEP
jgi:phosphate uptake regulator